MSMTITAAEVEAAVRGLIVATPTNMGFDVSVPVMYPGGDLTTVTVSADGDGYLVHDSSSAMTFLASVGVRLAPDARRKLLAVVAKYGCEWSGERVIRRCSRDQIPAAAAVVANASRAIADHALEVRRRAESDFREAVSEKIRAVVGSRIRTNEEVRGRSGRTYRVHNVILDVAQRKALAYVEPVANRQAVPSHYTEFADLVATKSERENICVYDDNADVRQEDLNLMTNVCTIIAFAQSDARFRPYAR